MTALIISTTGRPYYCSPEYDRHNHWRFTKPHRTYETLLAIYNDFHPEPGTYDYVIRKKGLKWNMIPEVAKMFDLSRYDYIGCYDDDFCTDIQSVNRSLELARQHDFRLFQQSLISPTGYECIRQNKDWVFSETNFIESGIPFFRRDIFGKVMEFLADYHYKESDWGLDKLFCHITRGTAHVVHEVSAKHMEPDISSYDHAAGFREMDYVMRDFFPKWLKEKKGLEYTYEDRQVTLRAWTK